jgi:hypothetical protein
VDQRTPPRPPLPIAAQMGNGAAIILSAIAYPRAKLKTNRLPLSHPNSLSETNNPCPEPDTMASDFQCRGRVRNEFVTFLNLCDFLTHKSFVFRAYLCGKTKKSQAQCRALYAKAFSPFAPGIVPTEHENVIFDHPPEGKTHLEYG